MRTITKAEIVRAVSEQCSGLYPMSLVGADRDFVTRAVNQGIDAHLQACYVPDRGDSYGPNQDIIDGYDGRRYLIADRLNCQVSGESLAVLLRRLTEMDTPDDDEDSDGNSPLLLASDILDTLGIEQQCGCFDIDTD